MTGQGGRFHRTTHKAGETWELDPEIQKQMVEINSRYEVDDPLQYDIINLFNVNPEEYNKTMATAQIIHELRNVDAIVGGSDQQIAVRIANILQKLGCEKANIRVNGHGTRVWRGVSQK